MGTNIFGGGKFGAPITSGPWSLCIKSAVPAAGTFFDLALPTQCFFFVFFLY